MEDAFGRSQMNAYFHGAVDHYLVAELQQRVGNHQRHTQLHGSPEFRRPTKLNNGPVALGVTTTPPTVPVRVPLSVFEGNTLTLASSGGGKNFAAAFIIVQIAPRVPSTWLISPSKAEFALLGNAYARAGCELIHLSGRDLKLNPLQPPRGVEPRSYAAQVADLLTSVFDTPPGAARLVEKSVVEAYRDAGCLDHSEPRYWPTLRDLRNRIATNKEAHPQSRSSLVNALDALLASAGEVFDYALGWDPVDLAEGFHLALSLGDLSVMAQDLVLNDLILRLFASRVAAGVSNPGITHYVVIDEANRLAGASGSGRCALSNLMPVVRGMGVALHCLAQSADLHPAVLSNTSTKFLGRTVHYPDLTKIGRSMGLTEQQLRYAATTLKPGRWIVQLADSAIGREPFELKVPYADFTRVQSPPPPPPPEAGGDGAAVHGGFPGATNQRRLLALPTHRA